VRRSEVDCEQEKAEADDSQLPVMERDDEASQCAVLFELL
jgi:hypothetical protein